MMFNKIANFYKSNKYAILWSIGYFVATWAIMQYMFNFNIFSRTRWIQLAHAHLYGFPGFVFGILILAAAPMYIATTVVIARNKAPLFTIKIPEFIKTFFINAFQQTPMADEKPVDAPTPETPQVENTDTPVEKTVQNPIPESVPSELRVAYARAREHIGRTPVSAFDLGNVTKLAKPVDAPTPTQEEPEDMPIPSDFDINDVDGMIDSVPQFTDVNFDDDDESDDEITEQEFSDIHKLADTVQDIVKYLDTKSVPYTIDGEVVITDKLAIVSHTDPDFWVADNMNWFAAGKTRKSPIKMVIDAAIEHNVQPVLYLGAENIMDIETLRTGWQEDGIRVITDLKDLITD